MRNYNYNYKIKRTSIIVCNYLDSGIISEARLIVVHNIHYPAFTWNIA